MKRAKWQHWTAVALAGVVLLFFMGALVHWVIEQSFKADLWQAKQVTPVTAQQIDFTNKGQININTADAQLLMTLPDIGEKRAQAIIQEREEHGLFHYPQDLMLVNGIGTKRMDTLRKLISVVDEAE